MGAAWREPKDRDIDALCDMVREVKALGLETCMTLGMLTQTQAQRLADAGLDYYNHNIDTGPEYYGKVITTRTLQDRLDTLEHVREAGMAVCCGGIIGMGEAREDRIGMLVTLANLSTPPESVPINALMKIKGTPLGRQRRDRQLRIRPHHRRRAHHDADVRRAPLRRSREHERRTAIALLPRRRELDLHRPEAADHRKPGEGKRRRAVVETRRPSDGDLSAILRPNASPSSA